MRLGGHKQNDFPLRKSRGTKVVIKFGKTLDFVGVKAVLIILNLILLKIE